MDRLLNRQIKRFLGDQYEREPAFQQEGFQEFLKAIQSSYEFNRKEMQLLERTVELNTKELNEANRRLKEQNDAIRKLATTDSLTGLANRLVCHDRVNESLREARANGTEFSLLFIDLDRFKIVNDTLGHQFGDQLLNEVAARLKSCVRQGDTVARLGGDEFTVLLENITDSYNPVEAARKILKALSEPYNIMGRELNITASIGVGVFPRDGKSVEDIFKNADTAMYTVKESGRNNFIVYDTAMSDKAMAQISLEAALRKALDNQEFYLEYQPKLNIETGKLVGMEALLRWSNPRLGIVPPDRFIPVAENTGMILPIGEWVLRQACLQNVEWQRKGLRPVQVAVNISVLQLSHPDFIDTIDLALGESGLAPGYLEIEITESSIMSAKGAVMANIEKLKERGITLSVDDFGTGYSSLSVIKQLPIDSLKIDRSFIRDIAHDSEDEAIVTAIIAMARSLDLSVIAEGVETYEQLQYLLNSGCDTIQGYLISKPLAPGAMEALLEKDLNYCHELPCEEARRAVG